MHAKASTRQWAGGDRVPRMWSHALTDDALIPEPALPAQVYHLWHHTCAIAPERALALAVLMQAVGDVHRYQASGLSHHQRLHDQAQEWMRAEDHAWPFSFVNLCAVFSIDVGQVRKEMAETPVLPARQAA